MEVNKACPLAPLRVRFAPQNCPIGYAICRYRDEAPFVRHIIRGKAAADVEFGAKLDLSIVDGLGHIEKISFEAYNESEVLQNVIDRYYQRRSLSRKSSGG